MNEEERISFEQEYRLEKYEKALLTPRAATFTGGGDHYTTASEEFFEIDEVQENKAHHLSDLTSRTVLEVDHQRAFDAVFSYDGEFVQQRLQSHPPEGQKRVMTNSMDVNFTSFTSNNATLETDGEDDDDGDAYLAEDSRMNEEGVGYDNEENDENNYYYNRVNDDDDDANENNDDNDSDNTDDNTIREKSDRSIFPFSRVRELLRFHSAASIVGRDAVVAASESVALMLQDLTRVAVAEAQRQRRKTVTYADLVGVVHHFDRFSFLTDIIPPLPSTVGGKTNRSAIREGTARQQAPVTANSRMRQATLPF